MRRVKLNSEYNFPASIDMAPFVHTRSATHAPTHTDTTTTTRTKDGPTTKDRTRMCDMCVILYFTL